MIAKDILLQLDIWNLDQNPAKYRDKEITYLNISY